ncbi:MAG: glycosyl transferase family 1, partial [Chloroflexi bacterium]|nr:glycosyl transferase family 1 [Chloroflexota bacterium]
MRILFLTPQLPYPPHKGTSIRNFHLIKNLAVHHEVHLLTFVNGPTAELGVLKDYCSQIHTVVAPKRSSIKRFSTLALSLRPDLALRLVSPQFASQLDSLLATGNFDLVQVEGLE